MAKLRADLREFGGGIKQRAPQARLLPCARFIRPFVLGAEERHPRAGFARAPCACGYGEAEASGARRGGGGVGEGIHN